MTGHVRLFAGTLGGDGRTKKFDPSESSPPGLDEGTNLVLASLFPSGSDQKATYLRIRQGVIEILTALDEQGMKNGWIKEPAYVPQRKRDRNYSCE